MPIGTYLHVFGGHRQHLRYAPSGGRYRVQFRLGAVGKLPVGRVVLPDAAEEDGAVLVGEGIRSFVVAVESQPSSATAPGRHGIDVEVPVAVAGEGEPAAVGAPYGHVVVGVVEGELGGVASGGGHGVEVTLVGEGDGGAVGGDGWVAEPGLGG